MREPVVRKPGLRHLRQLDALGRDAARLRLIVVTFSAGGSAQVQEFIRLDNFTRDLLPLLCLLGSLSGEWLLWQDGIGVLAGLDLCKYAPHEPLQLVRL